VPGYNQWPRDGDGDGQIYDGKHNQQPVPAYQPTRVASPYGQQPVQPPAPVPVKPPGRDIVDVGAIRKAIQTGVLTSAAKMPPMRAGNNTLTLSHLAFDKEPDLTPNEEVDMKLAGGTLSQRLVGTWTMTDPDGNVVDSRTMTVAQVPYLGSNGTFLHNGSDYTLAGQARLLPGVYTHIRQNGELDTHVNIPHGSGPSFNMGLNRDTGIFTISFDQSNIPLYSVFRALGLSDEQLEQAWGKGTLYSNKAKADGSAVNKVYTKLVRAGDPSADESTQTAGMVAALAAMPLDSNVMQRNLGKPYTALSPAVLLAATTKLLGLSRGTATPDDRDHPANLAYYGPEDLISERAARPGGWLRHHAWRAGRAGNLDRFPPGAMTRPLFDAILSSGLGTPSESVNPLQLNEQRGRISRLGVGGIPSVDAVPESSRDVHPAQYGFIDFIATPESMRAGVDARLASGVRKRGNEIVAAFRDMRTGQTVWKTPKDVANLTLGFPHSEINGGMYAVRNGEMDWFPTSEIDLEMPAVESALSHAINLVPAKSAAKPQRAAMAGRMLTQALPLVRGEAPWVQAATPFDPSQSYEEVYGELMGAVKAPMGGVVVKETPTALTLRYEDGTRGVINLQQHVPYNLKTGIHQTALVRLGDRVNRGQVLAKSNFTDEHGRSAIGVNARVAYIADKGFNFEDAISVSESFAKNKLASDHYYQHRVDRGEGVKTSKNSFISLYPGKFTRAQLDTHDEDGVVREGTVVNEGDPLILAARERQESYGKLHKGHQATYSDASETWEHHAPGVVRRVVKTPKGTTVVVQTTVTAKPGDKLSGRIGDKGVIARIIPDDEMPVDANGQPFEALINPAGLISRANATQAHEAVLGAIAEKMGQAYKVPDFAHITDLQQYVANEARRYGVSPTNAVHDPATGTEIKDIDGNLPLTGSRWLMKLHHVAEAKAGARSTGGYTAEGIPAKGGAGGAKRLGLLDTNALLSHGATEVLRESSIRGQANPEYWASFMTGNTPASIPTAPIYAKLQQMIQASGVNVVRSGHRLRLSALTDKDVDTLAGGRELENADTVNWEDAGKPISGGLFDETLTGGPSGRQWSKITLAEPMPNPVMEEPIRRILNLTKNQFRDVLAGKAEINGMRGPSAIHAALDRIDVPAALKIARMDIESGKKGARDLAVRRMKYLKSADKFQLHPRDWMLTAVPVLPPSLRPVSMMRDSGVPLVADANMLYRDLFEANDNWKNLHGKVDDVGVERLATYDAFKAITGLGDPISQESQDREVRGLLKHVFGRSPKFGMVQRKLLGTPVDMVGRATVLPNPDLDMDQVGIPENLAWTSYADYTIRRMVRNGVPRVAAVQAVKNRTPIAKKALYDEMQERPVFVVRPPVLHRYGVMAFNPVPVKGDAIHVSPMIVTGFNMDFDGDAVQFHVPSSDEAKRDMREKMLPSRNLFSPATFKADAFLPGKEYVGGLYQASTYQGHNEPIEFDTTADAIAAYNRGELGVEAKVRIRGR